MASTSKTITLVTTDTTLASQITKVLSEAKGYAVKHYQGVPASLAYKTLVIADMRTSSVVELPEGAFTVLAVVADHPENKQALLQYEDFIREQDINEWLPIVVTRLLKQISAEENHEWAWLYASPAPHFITDQEGLIRAWNQASRQLTGIPENKLIGIDYKEVLKDEPEYRQDVSNSNGDAVFITRITHNHYLQVLLKTYQTNAFSGYLGSLQDISEYIRVKKARNFTHNHLKKIWEGAEEAIFVVKEGKIIHFNKKLPLLLNVEADKLYEKPVEDFIDLPEQTFQEAFNRLQKEPSVYRTFSGVRLKQHEQAATGELRMQYIDWYGTPALLVFFKLKPAPKSSPQNSVHFKSILQKIFELSIVAIRYVNKNYTIQLHNKQYETLNNHLGGNTEGSKCYETINSQNCGSYLCPLYQLSQGKEYVRDEVELSVAGNTRYFVYEALPVTSKEGSFEGMVETFSDITDNKQTEFELRKFQIISEQNPVGIIITDYDGTIEYANRKVVETTGYHKSELIGQTSALLNSGKQSKAFYKEFWSTIKSGKEWRGEFENKRKDGAHYFVKSTIAPLKDDKDRIVRFIAMTEDVTPRKMAEQKLRERERQYRLIADSIQDVIITLDLGFAIDFVTPSIQKFLGYTPKELIGVSISALLANESKETFRNTRKYILNLLGKDNTVPELREPIAVELQFVTKSGTKKWGETQFSYTQTAENKFIGLQAVTRDITESKFIEWENKRNEANKNALLNNNQQAFILLDKNRNVLAFNNQAGEFAYTVANRTLRTNIPLDDYMIAGSLTGFQENFAKALKGEEISVDRSIPVEDRTIWYTFNYTPVVATNGEITGVSLGVLNITRRKEVETKLKENEQLFRVVADYTYHWEVFRNREGNLMYCSPKFETLTGYAVQDYYNGTVSIKDFVHPEDFFHAFAGFKHALQGHTLTNFEFRIVRRNGSIRYVTVDAHPVVLPDGKYLGFRSSIRDISDKKRAYNELQKSKEEFQSMFDHVPVGLYRTTPDGQILMANPALLKILNYNSLEELRNHYFFYQYKDKKLKSRRKFIQLIENKGQIRNYKAVWYTREGERVYVEENAKAVRDENNKTRYYEGSAININNRLAAQKKERDLNRMFRFLSISAIDLIMKENEDEIYHYVGEHLSRFIKEAIISISVYDKAQNLLMIKDIYGLTEEMEQQIQKITDFCPFQRDLIPNPQYFNTLLSGKLTFIAHGLQPLSQNYEVSAEELSELRKKLSIDKFYIIGLAKSDELYAAIQIFTRNNHDIRNISFTETFIRQASIALQRKLMEHSLKIEKDRAEHANQAKSEFLANMSHEIRTPMNAVLGFAELLNSNQLDKTQQHYLSSIQSSGKTLLNLINDILDMSKIEAGQMQINQDPINLSVLLREVEDVFQLKIMQKAFDFQINKDPSLPDTIKLDELRLRQILLNLTGNAIKFTEEGMVHVNLKAQNLTKDHFDLIIEVKDTGKGIPETHQEAIFEAFRQQDAKSTRKYGGTGLGLAITKKLVEIMNGTITLESAYKQGSTFTVTFRNVEIVSSEQAQTPEEVKDWQRFKFENKTIMVVDDVESNRNLLQGYMQKAGLKVITADEGEKATLFAIRYQPALIFLDIRMPGLTGYEVLEKLRINSNTNDIPVIAVTASVMKQDEEQIKDAGFNGYIRKPIHSGSVLKQLKRFINYSYVENGDIKEDSGTSHEEEEISDREKAFIPELIAILEQDYLQELDHLLKTKSVNNIKAFAEKLLQLAEKYPVKLLKSYSDKLYNSTKRFDVLEIENSLKAFTEMLEKLKANNGK